MTEASEMTKEELRFSIAERLGWMWVTDDIDVAPCLIEPGIKLPCQYRPCGRPESAGRYDLVGVPDWPADPAAADSLLDDLDRRGAHYELASLKGGYQLAIITDAPMDEIWSFSARGQTRQEAICRAWLKATVAE